MPIETIKILTVSSHMFSRLGFLLLVTVHFPPFAHSGSSHLGSTPALNKWKSAFAGNLLGLNIWSYKLQKKKFNFQLNPIDLASNSIIRINKEIKLINITSPWLKKKKLQPFKKQILIDQRNSHLINT